MPSIPWYQSPVYIGIVVNLVWGAINLLNLADVISLDKVNEIVVWFFGLVSFGALVVAEIKRRKSSVQPITLRK